MTFDEWCAVKQIEGDWKESLFHRLSATYGLDNLSALDETHWEVAWLTILERARTSAGQTIVRGLTGQC